MARETDIDRLYGLEPVIEPGDGPGGDGIEQFADVACPWCNEPLQLHVDLTAGDQDYIEDCQVCCQPITVHVGTGDGQLQEISVARADR